MIKKIIGLFSHNSPGGTGNKSGFAPSPSLKPAPLPYDKVLPIQVPSPHFRNRVSKIEAIVLHDVLLEPSRILKTTEDILAFFQDPATIYPGMSETQLDAMRVSAHYIVDKDTVYQMVQEDQIAWAVGHSLWNGKQRMNNWSLSYELVNWNMEPFTEFQYEWLAWKVAQDMAKYDIGVENIVSHKTVRTAYQEMAKTEGKKVPKNKYDPRKNFDWQKFNDLLPRYKPGPTSI